MKVIFAIFAMSVAAVANATTFTCEMINSKETTQNIVFDSNVPSMTSNTTYFNADGTVKSKESQAFMDSNFACDLKVNIKADCKLTESNQNGYTLWIDCPNYKFAGEVYIDNTGFGGFSCNGIYQTQLFDCKYLHRIKPLPFGRR